jgi:hypothetical protein
MVAPSLLHIDMHLLRDPERGVLAFLTDRRPREKRVTQTNLGAQPAGEFLGD